MPIVVGIAQLASALELLEEEGFKPVYTDAHISTSLDELPACGIPDRNVNSVELSELTLRSIGTLKRCYSLRFLNDIPDLVSLLHVSIFGVEAKNVAADPSSFFTPYDDQVRSILIERLKGTLDDARRAVLDEGPGGVYLWYSINLPKPTSIEAITELSQELRRPPYLFGSMVVTIALGPAPASLLKSLNVGEDALSFFLCKFTSPGGEVEMTWARGSQLKIEGGDEIRKALNRVFDRAK